jgi:hypothetical protein
MFGEEDVVNNRKATTSSVCISSEALVYCIKADEFLNRMSHPNNEKTWQMIIERVYKKDISTKKKIKNAVYNYHRENQEKEDA